ncbi:MAG: ADYC domain-containing protein, partial [Kofleriaceae bacterium]
EQGFAGIGEPEQLLITHFMPGGEGVRFQARYFETTTSLWRFLVEPGNVMSADYDGETGMSVLSVTEQATVPTWALQGIHPHRVIVTGGDLARLKLHLRFDVGTGNRFYDVDFAGVEATRPLVGQRQPTHYVMRWGPSTPANVAPRAYCQDARGAADAVVFQQGLDVDPISGAVVRNAKTAAFVTMSCGLGAPAIAFNWGYDYGGPLAETYFDAAIQMKRASYCADAGHYTVAGTPIGIGDDRHTNSPPNPSLRPEASWTRDGATCVNLDLLRHPEKGFTGSCGTRTLPACAPPPTTGPYLDDWRN